MLLLQRGGVPERRAARASGSRARATRSRTGASGPHTRRRGPARRRDSGDLRRSVSDALEALAAAVRKGDPGAVEALFDADPSLVNARRPDGSSFVLFAIYSGHARLVSLFRERGRSLDLFEATAAGALPERGVFERDEGHTAPCGDVAG